MKPVAQGSPPAAAPLRLVEGPRGLPFLGTGLDFTRDPLRFLEKTRARYGDFVHLPMSRLSTYLCSDPGLAEQVLVTDAKHYGRDQLTLFLRELLGGGLLTSEGDLWLRQRRLSQPAFHRDRLAAYGERMVESARRHAAALPIGTALDVHERLMQLTLDIVSRALFSADVSEHIAGVGEAMEVFMARYADPLLMLFPRLGQVGFLPSNRRFHEQRRRVDRVLYDLIAQRHRCDSAGDDLLGLLLAARDEDGSRMSDEQLRDEVVTLFLAGHETTALALTYTLQLLAKNPEVEAKLVAEIDEVLAAPGPGAAGAPRDPTTADLPKLRYCEAVILESMRMYPPAWILSRAVREPVSLCGALLPKDALVWIPQWLLHRDPRWFPEPRSFRPERWLAEAGEEGLRKRLPRCQYMPFGAGQRMCIGNSFAMMEAVLILATWLAHLRFEVVLQPLELLPSVTLRPRSGLRAKVHRRRDPT